MSSVGRSPPPRLSQSSKTPNKGSGSPCTCTWTTLPTHASTHDDNPPLSAMRKPPPGIFYNREHCLIFAYSPKCLEEEFREVHGSSLRPLASVATSVDRNETLLRSFPSSGQWRNGADFSLR